MITLTANSLKKPFEILEKIAVIRLHLNILKLILEAGRKDKNHVGQHKTRT